MQAKTIPLILVLAFACALLAFPNLAFADTGYCSYCDRITSGTYYYPASEGCYEPTCTESGMGILVCAECGNGNRPQSTPALGHSYYYSYSTASCTASGQDVYACSRCGNTMTEYASALGHSYYLASEVDATCTEEGSDTYSCSRCGDTYSQVIEALGHDYACQTTEPTCTKAGKNVYTCSRCNDTYSEPIAALGHDMEELASTAPTCIGNGSKSLKCKRCGAEEEKIVPALGHAWPNEWTVEKEPTSFTEGLEFHLCTRCGTREERAIARLPLTGTPTGIALLACIIAVVIGGGTLAIRKWLAARALAVAAAGAGELELISLTERKIFAKLADTPSNTEFLDVVRSRPNLALVLFDPKKEATLSEQIAEAEPNAVLLDCSDAEGCNAMLELSRSLRKEHGEVKFEAIAFDSGETVLAQLAAEKDAGTLFAFAEANQNKYVKMSQLVVPLYKDFMKDSSSLKTIAVIADLFGIPAVSTWLNAVVDAKSATETAATIKDAFAGEDLELSDGISVVSNIAELLGLDAVAAIADTMGSASEAHDSATTEDGPAHQAYKAGEAAKDIRSLMKHLLK